jgi:hypothetical protein
MGPRVSLDGWEKSRLHRDSIPGPSSPQRVSIPTELSWSLLRWLTCFFPGLILKHILLYNVSLSVLDPRKCKYLKDYSLDFEHAYMTTYLDS